jgi:uncharacterized membrane protein
MQIAFYKPKIFSKRVVIHFGSCHRMPERSFFWKGRQFPFCARCTGIYAGYLALPLFVFNAIALNFVITLLLFLPAAIDGFTQAFSNYKSNNILRATTGLLTGIGVASLISISGEAIGMLILYIMRVI